MDEADRGSPFAVEPTTDELQRALAQVFQQAAFLFAEPADSVPRWRESVVEAQMAFRGPLQGHLTLTVATVFASELACAIVGVEPGDPRHGDATGDALGELLTMVFGNLSARLFGQETECEWGIPWAEVLDPLIHEARFDEANVTVTLFTDERQRIDLALCWFPSETSLDADALDDRTEQPRSDASLLPSPCQLPRSPDDDRLRTNHREELSDDAR